MVQKNNKIDIEYDDRILTLRSIALSDLENLRNWKNANKEYFFHKSIIAEPQQLEWFNSFLLREDDYMFVVEDNEHTFGCMGIRLIDNNWDAYNIILGNSEYGGRGYMSVCFIQMLQYAKSIYDFPITLKVLKLNPAVGWYIKNGFEIISEQSSSYNMIFNPNH